MGIPISSARVRHRTGCEHAAQADCRCQCRGAGHQRDLIVRAAWRPDHKELRQLRIDLGWTLGGFRAHVRDADAQRRRGRPVLEPTRVSSMKPDAGAGANRMERDLMDEGLHRAFRLVAWRSIAREQGSAHSPASASRKVNRRDDRDRRVYR